MVGAMSASATNRLLAVEAVRWALAHGVAEVVLCAGARNLPLVAAWLGVPAVRVWHHPEERSAAFFAPSTRIVPSSFLPPCTTNASIRVHLLCFSLCRKTGAVPISQFK